MQIVVRRFLEKSEGSDVFATKQALLCIVVLQYVPRYVRILPLTSELKRTVGVFAQTAWLVLYVICCYTCFPVM